MPAGQLDLMREWDRRDPPDAAERARNDRIAELQGVRNRFIDAHGATPADDPVEPAPSTPEGVRVRIATWNIANLHFTTGEHLPGRPTAARRSDADFARLAAYVARLEADIVAFQEVNGPAAARRVFPDADWEIVVSNRFDEDAASGRPTDHIYTGVAVRRNGSARFIAGQTYEALGIDHTQDGETRAVRRGTEVLVELPNGEPLQVMSIHLKSGCHQGRLDGASAPACETLARQRAPLEAWSDTLTEENTPFVIAGDWNRRIDLHGPDDHLWREIDDGQPAPLDLFRFPENLTSPCLSGTPDHRPKPIDFIVTDEQAARWADGTSVRIVDFDASDKPQRAQISDHCPVVLDLFVPTVSGG
jgi:endonuclease/exonuclease/phosphatase family metal-dependent hydrolase